MILMDAEEMEAAKKAFDKFILNLFGGKYGISTKEQGMMWDAFIQGRRFAILRHFNTVEIPIGDNDEK